MMSISPRLMFLFDCLFFGLVIAYMDTVAPGKYGVAKPWYFPLQVRTSSIFDK
jgi:hypothetical protein